jgi:hypothetical protein
MRLTYAIGTRRWWWGGGYDVLEANADGKSLASAWPVSLAWFRQRNHAELFVSALQHRYGLDKDP